jgi:hypothetical protein
MKRVLLAALAALGVSACAEDYYGPYGGGGVAYYDDFYGPYSDGYWGPDGYFWYGGGRGHPYFRDEGHHFHHQPRGGDHGVHAHPGFHGFPHHGRAPGAPPPSSTPHLTPNHGAR